MRVAKTDTVAGLPAELAHSIVHRFRGREMVAGVVADLIEGAGLEPDAVLLGLEAAGYMEKVRVDNDGDVWWDTTIEGNALTMASFGKTDQQKDRRPARVRVVGTCARLQR